ncbi:MAG: phosphotransferase family protein [Enterococcaceae bacterium]|nr:phosphotransferase family protein [Enterococcaceae bacterium]MCI1920151.1 phosphotransferase family protein [Enterococcaceae bacterium]
MDYRENDDWQLKPLPGETGQAYMGIKHEQKLFIKRNTSPFLAALSREAIVPKLVWTKRLSNGDVLTAQEWLEGRVLTAAEAGSSLTVIEMFQKIHHSASLKKMLGKVGGKRVTAFGMLCQLTEKHREHRDDAFMKKVLSFLEAQLPEEDPAQFFVVHGDINRRNWFLTNDQQLYLVDWDSAVIGNAAIDLGNFLFHYVPIALWPDWLNHYYGREATSREMHGIYWYGLLYQVSLIDKRKRQNKPKELAKEQHLLNEIFLNL